MAKKSATAYLSDVPLFAGCSRKELTTIAGCVSELGIDEGQELTRQGEPSHEAFVIMSGTATAERNGTVIGQLGPGDTIGELGLLDRSERTATVVAETPLRVLVIGRREFSGMLQEVPAITKKLLANLAGTVRELDEKSYG